MLTMTGLCSPPSVQVRPETADTRLVPGSSRLVALFVAVLLFMAAAIPAGAATAEGSGQVHGGFYSDDFFSSGDLNALASATGKRVSIGGTFMSFKEDAGRPVDESSNTRNKLNEIWKGKATPFANIDFWPDKPSAATIAGGAYDAQIRQWVNHLKSFLSLGGGRSLILAPMQEMNGKWTSYGCSPSAFKTAFRRIVDIIRAEGIDETKVRFAWAPNGWTDPNCASIHDYYPGDSYVDIIGISAYRWSDGGTVGQVMGSTINDLAAQYPTKPLVIAQTAVWPSSSKSQWIRDMFSWAANHPHVVALIYFNFDNRSIGETDWRIWNGSSLDAGWRDGMRSSSTAYQFPLSSWFDKGTLVLGHTAGKNLCGKGKRCHTLTAHDSSGRFRIFEYAASGLGRVSKSFIFGRPGDIPLSGDWDGDGDETIGLYRQSDGFVYLKNSNSAGWADHSFYFGRSGDVPIVGDFNGDGKDTVSVYRPSTGKFYIKNSLKEGWADFEFVFGRPGDKPFVGDFDGNGRDSIGLHRESTGLVYYRNHLSSGWADAEFVYGRPGDILVAGDWNGDGVDTVGVYRPSTGMFFVRNKNSAGNADAQAYIGAQSGIVSMLP